MFACLLICDKAPSSCLVKGWNHGMTSKGYLIQYWLHFYASYDDGLFSSCQETLIMGSHILCVSSHDFDSKG